MNGMTRIHLIGICGTAMATLAALLKSRGYDVRGSDQNVYPPMSDFLREQGITTLQGYRAEHISADIDLVVVGTFTPDMPFPSTACQVQHALGLNAAAMDVQAACAGFLYALVTGMQFVASGSSQLALVVGADCNSRILNPKDQRTYPLFGDAAGAVLLARGTSEQGLAAYTLGSDGSGGTTVAWLTEWSVSQDVQCPSGEVGAAALNTEAPPASARTVTL